MNDSLDKFIDRLKQEGYSVTKQRLAVFNVLQNGEPITIKNLIEKLDSQIDRVSVYRIVTLFEKIGIVQRVNIGWSYQIELSDQFSEHHHHLICINCGKIIPINEEPIEEFIEQIARQNNFLPKRHDLEIHGLCPDCQKKR